MQKQDFKKLFEHGPVILDGATGSNLMKAGMPKGVCTEKWVLEHPDTIIQLQRAYAEAGSQIIYAPTFAANRISLANHGLSDQVDHYNHALVALSKEAVQGRALIAGDITTTSKMDAEYDGACGCGWSVRRHRRNLRCLVPGGCRRGSADR